MVREEREKNRVNDNKRNACKVNIRQPQQTNNKKRRKGARKAGRGRAVQKENRKKPSPLLQPACKQQSREKSKKTIKSCLQQR
jgi:hypothetical protein